jgi:hypothetical protein
MALRCHKPTRPARSRLIYPPVNSQPPRLPPVAFGVGGTLNTPSVKLRIRVLTRSEK